MVDHVPTPPSSRSPSTSPRVDVFATGALAAAAAAEAAATALRECVHGSGQARIMVGTGNSQLEMIRILARQPNINWSKVDAFHLDEYVGISANHPSSFRYWLRHNFVNQVHPRSIAYIEGASSDLDEMVHDYGRQLLAEPVDLAFVGIC